MNIKDLKTSTLQSKLRATNKKLDQAHMNADYDKLDDLSLLRNQLEVELETRGGVKQ